MGKYKREPLGIRKHNPGCIRGKGGKGYAHYASDEEGYYALINLLKKRYTNKTAYQIFTVYAPASDGNNPKKYANNVIKLLQKQGLKVTGSTKLDMNNPQILRAFCLAISRIECGREIDPHALDRALARHNSNTGERKLAQTSEKQNSSSRTTVAATANSSSAPNPPKLLPMVALYYNKVHSLNALDPKKTPERWKQYQNGIISYKNIPSFRDSFENHTLHAMVSIEEFLSSNSKRPVGEQIQKVIAIGAKLMKNDISAKDPRCSEALISMTGAALVEMYQRQGQKLTQKNINELFNTARDWISNSCLRENPSRFLAQCNKILNPTGNNTSRLNKRLAKSSNSVHGNMSVQEDSLMWQRVVANNTRG